MSNNQATIEDLIDEMYDVLDKAGRCPFPQERFLWMGKKSARS